MTLGVSAWVSAFLVSAAIGVFASVTKRRGLLAMFKPLTTILLLPVVGWPATTFAWLVVVGVLFSLGGDVALLSPSQRAFLIGLALFLVAHVTYIGAFVWAARRLPDGAAGGSVGRSVAVVGSALAMAGVTAVLLRKSWPGAVGMRGPLVAYAIALALMVVTAFTAVGGGLEAAGAVDDRARAGVPIWAPIGAVLFYVSDASLALDRFSRPIQHAGLLTLGLYWLGQLGIALSARLLGS